MIADKLHFDRWELYKKIPFPKVSYTSSFLSFLLLSITTANVTTTATITFHCNSVCCSYRPCYYHRYCCLCHLYHFHFHCRHVHSYSHHGYCCCCWCWGSITASAIFAVIATSTLTLAVVNAIPLPPLSSLLSFCCCNCRFSHYVMAPCCLNCSTIIIISPTILSPLSELLSTIFFLTHIAQPSLPLALVPRHNHRYHYLCRSHHHHNHCHNCQQPAIAAVEPLLFPPP